MTTVAVIFITPLKRLMRTVMTSTALLVTKLTGLLLNSVFSQTLPQWNQCSRTTVNGLSTSNLKTNVFTLIGILPSPCISSKRRVWTTKFNILNGPIPKLGLTQAMTILVTEFSKQTPQNLNMLLLIPLIPAFLKNVLNSGVQKLEIVKVKVSKLLGSELLIRPLTGLKLVTDMVVNFSEPLLKKLVLVNLWTGTTPPAHVIILTLNVLKKVRPPLFSI